MLSDLERYVEAVLSVPYSVEDAADRHYLEDQPGLPLGVGMPSGSPLREDGQSHREGWMSVIRRDPCSYCGGPAGTVDHVEPRSRRARGLGGAHSWLNYAAACERCNGRKGAHSLLMFLAASRNCPGATLKREYPPRLGLSWA